MNIDGKHNNNHTQECRQGLLYNSHHSLELLGITRVPILQPGRGAEPRLRARGEAQPAPQQRPAGPALADGWVSFILRFNPAGLDCKDLHVFLHRVIVAFCN